MQSGMTVEDFPAANVPGGVPWRISLFLMLLFAPPGAWSVTVQDSSYTGLPADPGMTADAGYGDTGLLEHQANPGQLPPADAVILPTQENVSVMPLQELAPGHARQRDDAPNNRLLLFFLLLMAAVSGLLIEIATTRRQG